jgi:hypothetical protein
LRKLSSARASATSRKGAAARASASLRMVPDSLAIPITFDESECKCRFAPISLIDYRRMVIDFRRER